MNLKDNKRTIRKVLEGVGNDITKFKIAKYKINYFLK